MAMLDVAMYYLYMGIRLMPTNYDGIKYVESIGQVENDTGTSITVKDKLAVVSFTDANGCVLTCVNASDEDVGFFVDMNTRKFDAQKSWRIKVTYPEISFQDIIDQTLGTTMRGWNFFSFKNEVQFDSLSPTVVSTSPTQKVLLWNMPANIEALSTPWIKHCISVNIRKGEVGDFGCHFYKASDINMDGKTDAIDLSIINSNWGNATGDVNGDGTTNAQDTASALADWG